MANAWILKPLAISAASASTTALGAAVNVGIDYAGMVWQSTVVSSPSLLLDLGADMPVDTIILFGLLGGFSPSATVQIVLSTTAQGTGFNGSNTSTGTGAGNYWTQTQALLAGSAMPVSGKGVMAWAAPTVSGPPSFTRYVRLTFLSLGGGAVQVSRAVIGKRIQLARNFGMGGNFGVRDLGALDFSARGVMLRRRGAKLRTASVTFSSIYKDEVEASVKPLLEQIGNTETVALLTDPADDPQRQNRAYFGTLVGDLGVAQRNSAGWEAKANLVSLF